MDQTRQSVAEYKQQLASRIGEEASKISVLKDSASVLQRMQEGVIISLHIEGTRRFWKKLTLADLGLALEDDPKGLFSEEASSVLANYFKLGSLSLLPSNKQIEGLPEAMREQFVTQEELATLERSARYCLQRHSFKSHWGAFVPVTRYEQWKQENAEYEAAFTVLKDRLIANYDAIVNFVVQAYRPVAVEAWRMVSVNKSLLQGQGSVTDEVLREVTIRLSAGAGMEVFVENYLESIRSAIRSREDVEASFAYMVERSIVPLPSLLAQDMHEADRLYADRAIRDAQVSAELEKIEAERRLEQQRINAEELLERDRRYMQLQAERERLQLQLQMERDVLEDAKRNRDLLLGQFYTDVVGQINDRLQLVCTSVLESIEEHQGTLRGPVSRQLRNIVTELEGLNFMEIGQVDAMLAQIRDALPTKEESEQAAKGSAKIDTTRLQTVLHNVQQEAKAAVIELGLTPSVRRARPAEALSEGLLEVESRKARPGTLSLATTGEGTRRRRRTQAS